jgi:glutamate synthase (NADPH/NADH) small chain
LHTIRVRESPPWRWERRARSGEGTEITTPADLVILAMGFEGIDDDRVVSDLGMGMERGVIATDATHATTLPGVFVAGDARRGASLVVWAIREGRDAAVAIDRYSVQPRLT